MRKSPLAIALSIALLGTQVFASESFDSQLSEKGKEVIQNKPDYDPNNVTAGQRSLTKNKIDAISGSLYEQEQLKELREMLVEGEISKQVQMQKRIKNPVAPDEVTELRREISAIEKAQNEPLTGIDFRIRNITYNPDSNKPLVIDVADGFAAQVEFYDASGQPWSIRKDGVIGDSESFAKKIMGENRHITSFSLSSRFKQSNAAVILDGLSNTIPVLLRGSDSAVDGRVSVTIPRMGPNAEIQPIFNHELNNVSQDLVKLQGGDAPIGSKPLRISGISNAEAWFDGEHLFLSLPGRMLLPLAINSSVSPSGRFLYKTLPSTYVSISIDGERKFGMVEGLYQADIRREKTIFEKDTN